MSRFLRIQNNTIHIPSLANVSIQTGCLGVPMLALDFHGQPRKTILYSWKTYDECEKDLIKIKASMLSVEQALAGIPLTALVDKTVPNELKVQETVDIAIVSPNP